MHSKVFRPFLWLGTLLVALSLACNITLPPSTGTQEPAKVVNQDESLPQTGPTQPVFTPTSPAATATVPADEPADELLVTQLGDLEKAVVNIEVEGTYRDPDEGWKVNTFKGGTGFIIDPAGIVVTNNHVATGAALVKVQVAGEDTPRNARILGASECSDLAVLDIEGDGFHYLKWYQGEIKAGMDVYAGGFPASKSGVSFTLTQGIVSKPEAPFDYNVISVSSSVEHTADVTAGSSGSPLVTKEMQVLGVHAGGSSSQDQGYAVSVKIARTMVEELRAGKDVEAIGINGVAVTGEVGEDVISGIWVRSVKSGSPADKARLQPGDIILQLESQVLTAANLKDYCSVLRAHKPSDTLGLTVLRWDSKEVFQGQINGRELEYMQTLEAGEGLSSGDEGAPDGTGNENGQYTNLEASEPGEYYFKDEFDSIQDWVYWLQNGKESGFKQEAKNGKFRTEIKDKQTYVYYRYELLTFKDVRLDTRVENLGVNTNFTGMFCRYSGDGWYEVDILSSGEFAFYFYDTLGKSGYHLLYSGASKLIKLGKDTNDYSLVCKGDELVLGINEVEVKRIKINTQVSPLLKEGQVGVFVSSESLTPVIIDFDWFYASVPH